MVVPIYGFFDRSWVLTEKKWPKALLFHFLSALAPLLNYLGKTHLYKV